MATRECGIVPSAGRRACGVHGDRGHHLGEPGEPENTLQARGASSCYGLVRAHAPRSD